MSSLLEQFEYPLPRLRLDTEHIVMETSGGHTGSFWVENGGGATLEGTITSNSRSIVFSPASFRGNKVEITYTLHLDIYRQGDVISTSALIMSNGGEAVVPVEIRIIPPAIQTRNGARIASLEDYRRYVQTHPVPARQLFTQHDFMAWLMSIHYEHMEMYEHLTRDPNKERAVDHFLILNKLKEKSAVTVETPDIAVTVKAEADETGTIVLRRTTWGFMDVAFFLSEAAPWLRLGKTRLSGANFGDDDRAEVFVVVTASALRKRRQTARIGIYAEGEPVGEIRITAMRPRPLIAAANREAYAYEDEGTILLTNNSGADMMVEIAPMDAYVSFEGKRYFIGEKAEIPFTVRLAGWHAMQANLSKQMTISTEVQVRAKIGEAYLRERVILQITACEP